LNLHGRAPYLTIGAVQEKRVFPDHAAFLSQVISWGFDSIEFKYEVRIDPDGMLRGGLGTRLGRIAHDHNIRVSVHAPYDDGMNLGTSDPSLLQETRKRVKYSIEFAQRVNAKHLTVHGGFLELGKMHDSEEERGCRPYEIARQRAGEKAVSELKARIFEEVGRVMEYGAKRGIKVALENLHGFSRTRVRFPVTPQDFTECREALGKLSIVYDTGHAHSTGLEPTEFISKVGPGDIIGTHIHDNDGTGDLHLPVGRGNIRFDHMLRDYVRLGWNFPLNIEVRSVEDFEESKRYFQEFSKARLMKKTGTLN
jgi:sugar phosphate isomerase/epimerase